MIAESLGIDRVAEVGMDYDHAVARTSPTTLHTTSAFSPPAHTVLSAFSMDSPLPDSCATTSTVSGSGAALIWHLLLGEMGCPVHWHLLVGEILAA